MIINEKKKLNQAQGAAVEHEGGPALIIAGAGTGKTTVLVERLRYLFEKKLALPEEILLLTFTEKGAGEMEDRALKVLPYGYVDLWISTFHSFCERILRQHALDIGLSPQFKPLDQTGQWILIKQNLDRLKLDYYRPLGNPNKFIYELTKHFSRLKDENISADEYLEYVENRTGDKGLKPDKIMAGGDYADLKELARLRELAGAYHEYNQILLEEERLDFGDLIFYTIKLFRERPNILQAYRKKFKFIMVDEFQDTNLAQYELLKTLSGYSKETADKANLMVVGDDDQAIYRFRGASMSNIMQFKDDFPSAVEVVLNRNYRSGQNILDAAYRLIQNNNPNRLEERLGIDKNLISETVDPGTVEYECLESQFDELGFTVEKIKELKTKNPEVLWSDFAVLVRANSSAELFCEELKRAEIPNIFLSLRGLYLKPIVLDTSAYFALLDNYRESSALFRLMNMPAFKVNPEDLVKLTRFTRQKGHTLFETLRNNKIVPGLGQESRKNIDKLVALVENASKQAQSVLPNKIFLDFARAAEIFKDKDFDRDREFYSHVNQFYQKIKRYEEENPDARLKGFMELFELERESGETGSLRLDYDDSESVKVMTVHAAKGLEFKYVFLPNLVDKKFPSISRKERIPIPDDLIKDVMPAGAEAHIEEERRLFYVALTRAKEKLFLLGAKDYGGVREKKPSIFLNESGFTAPKSKASSRPQNEFLRDLAKEAEAQVFAAGGFQIPKHFSFSQLAAFANCPLQYKFNWILGVPVEQKAVFVFGRVMHSTLRDFMAPQMTDSGSQGTLFSEKTENSGAKLRMNFKNLEKIFADNWQDYGYDSKEESEKYKAEGRKALKLFFEYHEQNGWPQVKFLEKSFLLKVKDYIFKGAIDRVDCLPDGNFEVIDYKTGNPKDKLTYQEKKQLLLYQIALEEAFGFKVEQLSFFYLSNGTKISFKATDKDIEKLKLELIKGVEAICAGKFPPKPGPLCAYCDFRNICEFRQ